MTATSTNKENTIVAFTLDFETGGLDCTECACTQIALHAVRLDTFETVDRFVRYIKPYNKQDKGAKKRKVLKDKYSQEDSTPMLYQDKALEYSAITMNMLESMGEDIQVVAKDMVEFVKNNTLSNGRNTKPFLIGQNIGFDIGFLQQLMEYGGCAKEFAKVFRGHKDFYGNFTPVYVDTIVLGQMALCHLPDITSYKLELLAERFGIELDDAHDADADVTATTNIAMVCAKRMRSDSIDDNDMAFTKTEKSRKHFQI